MFLINMIRFFSRASHLYLSTISILPTTTRIHKADPTTDQMVLYGHIPGLPGADSRATSTSSRQSQDAVAPCDLRTSGVSSRLFSIDTSGVFTKPLGEVCLRLSNAARRCSNAASNGSTKLSGLICSICFSNASSRGSRTDVFRPTTSYSEPQTQTCARYLCPQLGLFVVQEWSAWNCQELVASLWGPSCAFVTSLLVHVPTSPFQYLVWTASTKPAHNELIMNSTQEWVNHCLSNYSSEQ